MKSRHLTRRCRSLWVAGNSSLNDDREAKSRIGWRSHRDSVHAPIKQSPTFAKNANQIASISYLKIYWSKFVAGNFSTMAPSSRFQNIKGSMSPTIQPNLHSQLALLQPASQPAVQSVSQSVSSHSILHPSSNALSVPKSLILLFPLVPNQPA